MSKLKLAFSRLNTLSDNKNIFKNQEVRKAIDAVMLNRKTNHISKDNFIWIVKDNWIRNSPIKVGCVGRYHRIYGPLFPEIKGRTRYKEPPRFQEKEIFQIPESLYQYLNNIVLCVDFHYVNGVAVSHSISRTVDYRILSFPLSRSKNSIVSELK